MPLRFLPLPLVVPAGIAVGDAAGTSAAAAAGVALFPAQGDASGTSTAVAVSGSDTATGVASGVGGASAVSDMPATEADGAASGVGAASATATSTAVAVGSAAGSGAAHSYASGAAIANIVFELCEMDGIQIKPVSNTIVIIPEVGEPMTRKVYTGDFEDITGTFRLVSRSQALAIKDFWRDTLEDGTIRFIGEHPLTLEQDNTFIFLEEPRLSRHGHLYDVSIVVRRIEED